MYFDVSVLYINEDQLFESQAIAAFARKECETNYEDFKFFEIPLQIVFQSDLFLIEYLQILDSSQTCKENEQQIQLEKLYPKQKREEDLSSLRMLFQAASTITAKEEILKSLRKKLLFKASQIMICSNLVTGESGENLVYQLISSVCKGNGFQAPSSSHPVSSMPLFENLESKYFEKYKREDSFQIVHPLQNLTRKDIYFYSYKTKLNSLPSSSFTFQSLDKRISIDHLSRSFLVNLHHQFDHTIYSLLRCASKIDPPQPLNPLFQHYLSFPNSSSSPSSSPSINPVTQPTLSLKGDQKIQQGKEELKEIKEEQDVKEEVKQEVKQEVKEGEETKKDQNKTVAKKKIFKLKNKKVETPKKKENVLVCTFCSL